METEKDTKLIINHVKVVGRNIEMAHEHLLEYLKGSRAEMIRMLNLIKESQDKQLKMMEKVIAGTPQGQTDPNEIIEL